MPLPGPSALGRGVVVGADGVVPAPWADAVEVTVDEAVSGDPAAVVDALHRLWAGRVPYVVRLGIDPARFRVPQSITTEPWRLGPRFEPFFDRLHFLVWANTYDARGDGPPMWWWARKAARLGAIETPDGPADVRLADGTPAWIDGGPRGPLGDDATPGAAVVASGSVTRGDLAVEHPPVAPTADLAPDQLAAVAHRSGPARVIAPAGSGKTRVLTERLRHLIVDRGWPTGSVLAVAYNKEAQRELERRTTDFSPRVRTLNSLGLWILRTHRGRSPRVIDERDQRRLVDSLLPGKRRHRANTDPIGPYLEALSTVRLGLADPVEVESSRDDVDGFADLFGPYRAELERTGAVDFDEQINGAIRVLLADGAFRRRMQAECGHLLVDEFQDLTPAHVLLIRLLALPNLDVFGVGDDDQVIYGHNAADPGFLIDYAELFPTAVSHPLTVNYRCPVPVVDAARHLLGYNDRRVPKTIEAGPAAEPSSTAFSVTRHGAGDAATALVSTVHDWIGDDGVTPGDVAVLTRVNSLLLAPHVALVDAGVPVASVLHPRILERTGLRAALAYLRLGTAGGRMDPDDIVEILRRPTRGLPRWFPDRLARRSHWSPRQIRGIADRVPEKEAAKVLRLADDLEAVADAARAGTTRDVLEAVRDTVGLGTAMGLLDSSGQAGAAGSSHLDDLEGLLTVADLHPDPVGFEAWLRGLLGRPSDEGGVTLSTVHRVKGREWPRVVLFGVVAGILPHRLSHDIEEERRVLHVGITRGRDRVVVLTDRDRPSPFLGELDGTAPRRRARRPDRQATDRTSDTGRSGRTAAAKRSDDGIPATFGLALEASGGHTGVVDDADNRAVSVRLSGGGTLRVRFGERVRIDGQLRTLAAPVELWGPAATAETLLREWRTAESRAAGKPAYTVLSDAHLRGIALARPSDAGELAACDGIGPTKLDRWGDDILALLDRVD